MTRIVVMLLAFSSVFGWSDRIWGGENYALLVAVGDYDVKELRPLKYTRADVLDFQQALVDSGFAPKNIFLMHDDVEKLVAHYKRIGPEYDAKNFLPVGVNIRKRLELLLGRLRADDSVVVAFAGHGVQFKGEKKSYFCPSDAKLDQKQSLIGFDEVFAALKECAASRKLFLVDACQNDPLSEISRSRSTVDLDSVTRPQTENVPEGIIALFSCKAGQKSFELPELGHGVFFHHLLEGWKGKADRNADGKLTYRELAEYTETTTAEFADRKLGALQTPLLKTEFSGEWVLRELAPRITRGISYAEPKNERRTLDVYAAAGGRDRPVLFWIHGGGWNKGDKSDVGAKPQAFVDRGFVFVSTNYRLIPEANIGDMAADIAKAIRWMRDHARDYGGDPDRFVVAGWSAGSQLAALVCTDDRYLRAEGLSLSLIKACIPVDGDSFDVPLQISTVEAARANLYRQKFGDANRQKDLSPVTHVARGKSIPPFFLPYVGDHPETSLQTRRIAKALQDAGVPATTFPATGKDHSSIHLELGRPGDQPTRAMFEFLDGLLKRP